MPRRTNERTEDSGTTSLDLATLYITSNEKPLLVHDFSADPEEVAMTLDRRLQHQHVTGWIASGALAYITGDNGIGKSWLSAKLAVATASGRSDIGWFGRDGAVVRHGNVLWVAGELSSSEDYGRQRALMRGLGIDTLKYQIIYINRNEWPPFRFNGNAVPYEWKLLVRSMTKFALVILDPVNVVAGIDDENNNNEVRELIMQLRQQTANGGPTVVLTGHPGKSYKGKPSTDVIRAAGSWRDVDQIISVKHLSVNPEKTDRLDRIEHTKQNVSGMPAHPPMTFAITGHNGAVMVEQSTHEKPGVQGKDRGPRPVIEPPRYSPTATTTTRAAVTRLPEQKRNVNKILHYGEELGTATADQIGEKAGIDGRTVRNYMKTYAELKAAFTTNRKGGGPWVFTFTP